MQDIEVGSLVVRKSYGGDILFMVSEIIEDERGKHFILKGVDVRLQVDSFEDDLELFQEETQVLGI